MATGGEVLATSPNSLSVQVQGLEPTVQNQKYKHFNKIYCGEAGTRECLSIFKLSAMINSLSK